MVSYSNKSITEFETASGAKNAFLVIFTSCIVLTETRGAVKVCENVKEIL